MLLFSFCQALFGALALTACGIALRAALRRDQGTSLYLIVAGVSGLAFFLTVPGIRVEMIAVALLAIVGAALMIPADVRQSVRKLLHPGDELEIGDSTATRRRKH